MANKEDIKFTLKAVDEVSAAIGRIQSKLPGLRKEISKLNQSSEKNGFTKFGERMSGFGRKVKGVGQNMTTWLTLPILGMGYSFVKAAMNAEEAKNKFLQVFGNLSGEAESFSNTLGNTVGRSSREIQNSMATFQSFGVGLKMSNSKALEFSKTIASLAIDFASFHNMDDSEAQSRFISALSGSSEVLDKFGINIKEAAIKQQLLKMGFKGNISKATELQKVMARLAIIQQSMNSQGAIGDAGRTKDSLTNRIRALKSAYSDLAVELGNMLLPYAQRLVKALGQLMNKFRNLSPETKKLVLTIGAIVAVIGPLLIVIGMMSSGIGAVSSAIGFFGGGLLKLLPVIAGLSLSTLGWIAAIAAVVAAGIYLWKNWDKVKNFFETKIKPLFLKLWDGPLFKLLKFTNPLYWLYRLGKMIYDNWSTIKAYFTKMWDGPIGSIIKFLTPIDEIIDAATLIKDNWSDIGKFFKDLWEDATKAFGEFVDDIKNKTKALGTLLDITLSGNSGYLFSDSRVLSSDGVMSQNTSDTAIQTLLGPSWLDKKLHSLFSGNPVSKGKDSVVTVDFKNIPRGTEVRQTSGGPLDLNLGYSGL